MPLFGGGQPNVAKLKAKRDVKGLIKVFQSEEDWVMRWNAAHALGQVHAVEPLLRALSSNDPWMRKTAASVLGTLGDARVVEPLVAALGDRKADVREAAARALDALGWVAQDDGQRARYAVAQAHWEEAECYSTAAVEPLITALRDDQFRVILSETNCTVIQTVIQVLGRLGDPRAIAPLTSLLDEHAPRSVPSSVTGRWPSEREMSWEKRICTTIVEALRDLRDPQVVEPLVSVYEKHHVMEREAKAALEALGPVAVEPLIAALHNDGWMARETAVEVLAMLGDTRAVEPLIAALDDADWRVRERAAQALERLGWSELIPNDSQRFMVSLFSNGMKSILDQGADAVAPLITMLHDTRRDIRRRAAEALGRLSGSLKPLGDMRPAEPLIAALRDPEVSVREAAAEALGKLGYPQGVEPLIAALNERRNAASESERMRSTIAQAVGQRLIPGTIMRALGQIGDARAVAPLITQANGEDSLEAVRALTDVLRAAAADCTVDDLRKAARLSATTWVSGLGSSASCIKGEDREIDCSEIRQLARQELLRRGLEA